MLLLLLLPAVSNKRLELLAYNGFQAVDCLAHEHTSPEYASVREVRRVRARAGGQAAADSGAQLGASAMPHAGAPTCIGHAARHTCR